jgi:rhamnulokinase
LTYEEMTARAQAAPPFVSLVDPDEPSFFAPGDMPARIAAYCERTGQPVPADEGAFIRCCLESLALKYRWTITRLEQILQTSIRTIHVVGGGSKNAVLCQFAADACGRPVVAGPVEATAIGNILMQAIGRGTIGSLADLRTVVARSFPVETYEPRDSGRWADAIARFDDLVTV